MKVTLVPSSHQKLFNICKSFPCVLVPYSMNKYFLESIYIYHIGDTVDIYCLVIIPLTQVERSEDSLGYNTTNMVITSQRADGADKIRYHQILQIR